jgi:hypothetical protein
MPRLPRESFFACVILELPHGDKNPKKRGNRYFPLGLWCKLSPLIQIWPSQDGGEMYEVGKPELVRNGVGE